LVSSRGRWPNADQKTESSDEDVAGTEEECVIGKLLIGGVVARFIPLGTRMSVERELEDEGDMLMEGEKFGVGG